MTSPALSRQRILSVDVFRGMTLVAMILVNNPGNWATVYAPLLHADWHGCTPTDLIFPFFLFIVGVAIVLALEPRLEAGVSRRALFVKISRRSALLFALGLAVSGFPFGLFGPQSFGELWDTWRIPGVLQRIAVCYLGAALLFATTTRKTLKGVLLACLLGYWALLTWVPVPGQGAPDLDSKAGQLAAWVDRAVLGDHLWSYGKVYDPEGLLSTIPALATTLFGVFAGLLLRSQGSPWERTTRLFVHGCLLTAGGFLWSYALPLNKALWTSSYAVFTAGLAYCGLALCHYFFDLHDRWAAARPFVIYGVNAITVFVGSAFLARTLGYVEVGGRSLQAVLYQSLFAPWLPPHAASLAFATTWVVAWYFVLLAMHRRGLVLKV